MRALPCLAEGERERLLGGETVEGKAGSGRRSIPVSMLGRLRWSVRGLLPVTSPVVMAQAFAYLFGIGATLALLTLLFPHDPDRFVPGIVAPAVLAYTVAAVMLIGFERIPIRALLPAPGARSRHRHGGRVLRGRQRGRRLRRVLLLGRSRRVLLPRLLARRSDARWSRSSATAAALAGPGGRGGPRPQLGDGRRHADRGRRPDLASAAAQREVGRAARRGAGRRSHRKLGVARPLRRGRLVPRALPDLRAQAGGVPGQLRRAS